MLIIISWYCVFTVLGYFDTFVDGRTTKRAEKRSVFIGSLSMVQSTAWGMYVFNKDKL